MNAVFRPVIQGLAWAEHG